MSDSQYGIYSYIERKIVPELEGAKGSPVKESLNRARLIRLRQAATNPEMLLKPLEDDELKNRNVDGLPISDKIMIESIENFRAQVDLEKLVCLKELLKAKMAEHSKILIWSSFIHNLEVIRVAVEGLVDKVDIIRM